MHGANERTRKHTGGIRRGKEKTELPLLAGSSVYGDSETGLFHIQPAAGENDLDILIREVIIELDFCFGTIFLCENCGDGHLFFRQFVAQPFDYKGISLFDLVVIRFVRECERDDAEVDEVRRMDALYCHCNQSLDSEIHRADRRMFAGGALTVAVASDDNAVSSGIADRHCTLSESRLAFFIETLENDLCVFRNVAAVFQVDSGRHDVVRAGFVPDLDDDGSVDHIRQCLVDRRAADGLFTNDFNSLAAAGRGDHHGVINQELVCVSDIRVSESECRRIGDSTRQCRCRRDFRADQIRLCVRGSCG